MKKTENIDRRFWLETAAFMALLYGISLFVYLNGDDFMYAAFAHSGLIANVTDYYFTGNGRFWINILDSALLWFDRYAFLLLLPWIVLAFVVLLAKVVQRLMAGHSDWNKEKKLIRMNMVLFACLDVLCLRETVFWITGMMNYLFPAVVFLLGYLLFLKSRSDELSGTGFVFYFAVCLLASSSVEQFALMFVGMMTLHHGYDLIRRKRIPAYERAAYSLSVLALAALLLAPGNFARVGEQGSMMPSLVENVWTLVSQNTISPVAVPYLLMLSLSEVFRTGNTRSRGMAVNVAVMVGCLISPILDKAVFDVVLILLLAWRIVVLLIQERFTPGVWFLIFVGLGSQVMLLISAIWGFRCMLSMYMVYMLLIGCALYHTEMEQRSFVLAAGLLMSVHPVLAMLLCAALLIRRNAWNGILRKTLPTALRCLMILTMMSVLVGYARNAPVHQQNLSRTTDIRDDTIIIQELPDDLYSWYLVPIGEFHENYYRILHQVPDSVEIIYEELPE